MLSATAVVVVVVVFFVVFVVFAVVVVVVVFVVVVVVFVVAVAADVLSDTIAAVESDIRVLCILEVPVEIDSSSTFAPVVGDPVAEVGFGVDISVPMLVLVEVGLDAEVDVEVGVIESVLVLVEAGPDVKDDVEVDFAVLVPVDLGIPVVVLVVVLVDVVLLLVLASGEDFWGFKLAEALIDISNRVEALNKTAGSKLSKFGSTL